MDINFCLCVHDTPNHDQYIIWWKSSTRNDKCIRGITGLFTLFLESTVVVSFNKTSENNSSKSSCKIKNLNFYKQMTACWKRALLQSSRRYHHGNSRVVKNSTWSIRGHQDQCVCMSILLLMKRTLVSSDVRILRYISPIYTLIFTSFIHTHPIIKI